MQADGMFSAVNKCLPLQTVVWIDPRLKSILFSIVITCNIKKSNNNDNKANYVKNNIYGSVNCILHNESILMPKS